MVGYTSGAVLEIIEFVIREGVTLDDAMSLVNDCDDRAVSVMPLEIDECVWVDDARLGCKTFAACRPAFVRSCAD